MMMTPLASALALWATSIMNQLAPSSPHASTFSHTAEGMAIAAVETPVFAGEQGPVRTLALELAIALGESGFNPHATGDCPNLPPGSPRCSMERHAQSLGLFQIGKSNLRWLGLAEDDLVGEPLVQARAALKLVAQSFKVCVNKPVDERLGWYARGGDGCQESGAGRARMRHARSILATHPFTPPSPEAM